MNYTRFTLKPFIFLQPVSYRERGPLHSSENLNGMSKINTKATITQGRVD